MDSYKKRLAEAQMYTALCAANFNSTKTPDNQKFPSGTRVRIANNLGDSMSHFPSGYNATVLYSYAQMYGGDDTKSYCLNIDNIGQVSWYKEHQLTLIKD